MVLYCKLDVNAIFDRTYIAHKISLQKFGIWKDFLMFMTLVYHAHQGCIYSM